MPTAWLFALTDYDIDGLILAALAVLLAVVYPLYVRRNPEIFGDRGKPPREDELE